jgi:hypothetical protein
MAKKMKNQRNETKSVQMIFVTCIEICPSVTLNNQNIPQVEDTKYLRLHLDRRLNWKKHISTKRKQFRLQLGKMYWLLDSKSQLSTENEFLLYKTILKPIWAYGIQLWDTASFEHRNITKIPKQIP